MPAVSETCVRLHELAQQRGAYARADRRARIECLSAPEFVPSEIPGPAHLPVARRHIVHYSVAKDMIQRAFLWNVTSRCSDHNSKFCLAVELARKFFIVLDRFLRIR